MQRKCAQCDKPLPSNRWRFCAYECKKAFLSAQYRKNNPFLGTSPGTTGAISELRVAIDLMSKGYNVFRALSPNSPCDLAILKDKQLLRIEVRTSHLTKSGIPYRSKGDGSLADIWAWVTSQDIIYEPELPKS